MADSELTGVYLLMADLTISRDKHLTTLSGPGTCLAPSNVPALAALQHWALQIRDTCYEVTSRTYDPVPQRDEYVMKISDKSAWEDRRKRHGLKFEAIKVGATSLSNQEICREGTASYQVQCHNC